MENNFIREDINFYSNGIRCSAWLYLPNIDKKCPVIVMAHGLGGTKEMWLDRYAKEFTCRGYACLLFDYRNYGTSDGNKRQLVNVKDQLIDWNNAIDFIKKDKRIDKNKILIFGSSFSGGHSITLSAKRNDIKAAIAQCPYTNNIATIKTITSILILKFIPYLILDLLSCLTGYHPVMLDLAAPKGKTALMSVSEYDKFIKRVPKNINFVNKVPTRTILEFLKYCPSKYMNKINNPILIGTCLKDSLAPAKATIHCAKDIKNITLKEYNCGHFDIYFDDFYEEAIKDYIEFYDKMIN